MDSRRWPSLGDIVESGYDRALEVDREEDTRPEASSDNLVSQESKERVPEEKHSRL